MKRKQIKTHSDITRIRSIATNDEARAEAWSALVRGAQVRVWLADTGNWQVAINELEGVEARKTREASPHA